MPEQTLNLPPADAELDIFQVFDLPYPAWLERYLAWEADLTIRLNQLNKRGAISYFFGRVSRLGDGVFWYALMSILLIAGGSDALEPVLTMAFTGLLCTSIYKVLKSRAARLRPYQRYKAIHLTTQPLDQHSFPSGHTLHAVCFGLIAMTNYPALLPLLLPFTLLVALSRLVLGLHYLSDVAAAAAMGAGMALLGLNLAALV
jgi:undecaprenyl-diphosphatase